MSQESLVNTLGYFSSRRLVFRGVFLESQGSDLVTTTSQLLKYDPQECKPVHQFALSILPEANTEINCFQALDYL